MELSSGLATVYLLIDGVWTKTGKYWDYPSEADAWGQEMVENHEEITDYSVLEHQ